MRKMRTKTGDEVKFKDASKTIKTANFQKNYSSEKLFEAFSKYPFEVLKLDRFYILIYLQRVLTLTLTFEIHLK